MSEQTTQLTTPSIGQLQKEVKDLENANKLPTLKDLFGDDSIEVGKIETLNALLNVNPPEKWVKVHPYIDGWKYLPIDKVEFLLRKIFKQYRVEITEVGTAFNGVFVLVRVHYRDPISGEMLMQDGIGSMQLQTKKGTSPADLANINNGAISMAFPIAKTLAVKDACDHIGKIFGADLNRKDVIPHTPDKELIDKYKAALS